MAKLTGFTGRLTGGRMRGLLLATLALLLAAALGAAQSPVEAQTNQRAVAPAEPTGGNVPGGSLGSTSDAEIWRAVRRGLQGQVSIPNSRAGQMIQSEGEDWRAVRNGPLTVAGGWILLGMIGLLALFFLLRGRIRIEAGFCGRVIERFNNVERSAHWLTAVSFIFLALTGLNMLYGRHVLLPALKGLDGLLGTSVGPSIFATLTQLGKYAHNYLSFAFMVGVLLLFVLWVKDNLPSRYDLVWAMYFGGLFSKGVHPPSRKFNLGQKLMFWLIVLLGLSISLSGVALLFPFTFHYFAPTFQVLNLIGLDLPTQLTAMQEMQLSQLWHAAVGLVLIAIILAHIYIGSIGMEGAFDAMGSGYVDENWAREHHSIWVAETKGEPLPDPGEVHPQHGQPAE